MSQAISVKYLSRSKLSSCLFFCFCEDSFCFCEDVDPAQATEQETIDDPKALWRQGANLSNRESVQPNWGRIQAETQTQYARAVQPPAMRTRPVSGGWKRVRGFLVPHHGRTARSKPRMTRDGSPESMTKAVVLERLEGFVDQIDGPIAYVTLKSQYGDELTGEYSAAELAAKGIMEGRRFRVETVELNGAVRVSLEALPDEPVTEKEEDAISRRIGELLQGDELDGDY